MRVWRKESEICVDRADASSNRDYEFEFCSFLRNKKRFYHQRKHPT